MKKKVAWNTAGSIFYCVCQWAITIIVVHLASYEDAGYLSLAMTTSSSFSAISLFSMRNFQVSDIKGEYSDNIYVGSRIWTCLLAFVCCAVAAVFGNSRYQILCIDAFMLIRVAEGMVDVLHGINQKYDHYDYIGKSYILRGVITVAVFCIGLLWSKNLPGTLFVMAFLNLFAAVMYDWRKTSGLEKLKPELLDVKVMHLLKYCFPLVIFSFLLSLENLFPKTVLQQQYGAEQLGIYSSIASPTLVVQVFASVLFNPFLPYYSKVFIQKDWKTLKSMIRKLYLLLIGMCVIVTIGALLLGKIGLTILFGEGILENYYLFLPIVWCTILTAIVWIVSALLIAFRKIKILVYGMLINFIFCIGITYPIIGQYGMNGVSIVQIVVLTIYIIYMIIVCEVFLRKSMKADKTMGKSV